MPNTVAITPHPSATRTAGGTGAAIDLAQRTTADLVVAVSTITASTTLTVSIETSADGVIWQPLGLPFLPATAVQTVKQIFPGADRYIRATWTITGTGSPSVTFSVAGNAVLVYATPDDLGRFGAPGDRFEDVSDEDKDRFLRLATDEADGYVQEKYGLPLLKWGDDLRNMVASIATWMILTKVIGTNPEAGADTSMQDNSNAAYKSLREVARGDRSLVGIVDSTPEVDDDGGAFIYSDPPRGWCP